MKHNLCFLFFNIDCLFQPFLLATSTILLISITLGAAQRFQRRHGLSDFATTDLLRHARASTLSDEVEYPSIESRQLPNRRKFPPRQRALRPVLKPRLNRNRVNSPVSSEQQNLNTVQEGLPQQTKNQNRDGARYDKNGNRMKYPARNANKVPRKKVQHLLIPRKATKQTRPLVKVQDRSYQQEYLPKPLARRGPAKPNENEFKEQRLASSTKPDARQITASSQQSFAPQRLPTIYRSNTESYTQQQTRPGYNYKRPPTSYNDQPTQSRAVRRRVDPSLEAVNLI